MEFKLPEGISRIVGKHPYFTDAPEFLQQSTFNTATRIQRRYRIREKDPQYFVTAFPTLFPTGLSGHLDELSVKMSLEAFSKWTLSHHTSMIIAEGK